MATLLIRLQAAMQSWGGSSHFSVRDTYREPTRSGVIGLLCAAMGVGRDAALENFSRLVMGVRVDREGKLQRDYHIAQNILKASGKGTKPSEPSNRYYLTDAVFLVALEGEKSLLAAAQDALMDPHWPLFLGRKAFIPGKPVFLREGVLDEPFAHCLKTYPCLVKPSSDRLRVVLEDIEGTILRNDVPISFSERLFSSRLIRMDYIDAPAEVLAEVPDESF